MKQHHLSAGKSTALFVTVNALAIALVCISTMFIQIPIPLGYMHLGNCFILLAAVFFGHTTGILAGGIGSALADLLTGFPQWILPTLIIKSLMGLTAAVIVRKPDGSFKMASARTFLGAAAAVAVMVAGYFIGGTILYGNIVTGAAQIPGLALEGIVGIILFYVIGFGFEAAKLPKLLASFRG